MNRGSFRTRSFRRRQFSVFRYRRNKNGLLLRRTRKVSEAFEKRALISSDFVRLANYVWPGWSAIPSYHAKTRLPIIFCFAFLRHSRQRSPSNKVDLIVASLCKSIIVVGLSCNRYSARAQQVVLKLEQSLQYQVSWQTAWDFTCFTHTPLRRFLRFITPGEKSLLMV